jgi:minor extracellular serine protease Vpr
MKKSVVITTVIAAACIAAELPPPPAGMGTFSFSRTAGQAALQDLRKAAAEASAKGCGGDVRAVALVDGSFSPALLAQYGWRFMSRVGDVATLSGCAASLPYLCALPGIRYVKTVSRVFPTMDSVRKLVHADEVHQTIPGWSGPRLTGKGVLFGIIDTDFDTRHKAFLDSNGLTRFVALWDQEATPADGNRYGYGAIKDHAGLLADPLFGIMDTTHPERGHGTLMTSFAAGSEWSCPYYGVAPDVRIAAVKMGSTDQTIIDGLDWLFSIADSLGLPAVVNMSLGIAEGPHDGSSLVDRAIDSSSGPGRIVVGAAGNDGVKQEHAGFTLADGESRGTWAMTVPYASPWYVSAIDMWGDSGASFSAAFYVIDSATTAHGEPAPRKRLDSRTSTTDANPQPVMWNGNQLYFQVAAAENASPLNGKPHIQAIMFSPNARLFFGPLVSVPGGGAVHCWNVVQKAFRGLGVNGWWEGDFDISVNELGGTTRSNITVGAYNSALVYTRYDGTPGGYPPGDTSYHGLAFYSGRGPTVDGRIKPDIMAPGSNPAGAMAWNETDTPNCVWWPGWPAAPEYDGRYKVTGGTSVSSPIVAGVVAMMLEHDPTLTVEEARQIITETALTDAATGTIPPLSNIWGAGKVNALGAVDRLINNTAAGPPAGRGPGAAAPGGLVVLSGSRLRFTGSGKNIALELFSLQGRRIVRVVDGSTVSLARLPQGVYFARAVDGEKGRIISSRKVSIVK